MPKKSYKLKDAQGAIDETNSPAKRICISQLKIPPFRNLYWTILH
ncbi:hypothetical protein ACFSCX_00290 [Bacillus salitolerans]|uniref:Uncharacterized protein n=1 Tax=Bacillus salitolerans TaxID=1437434 RepID=A0ABW4LIB0_9BACI